MAKTALRAAMSGLLLSAACIPAGAIYMMAPSIQDRITALETNRQSLLDKSQAIIDGLGENVDLSDEQTEEIAGYNADVEKLDKQITALTAMLPKGQGRKTAPEASASDPANGGRRTVPAVARDSRRMGFNHLGDFALTVRQAAMRDETAINRISHAFANMNEGVGEDGGILVPPEWREGIMKVVEGEDSLLSMCDSSTTARNSVQHPKDETTPWGTSGIQVYWEGEGQAGTASGAKFKGDSLRLNKLFARIDVTDELLEDAPQLDNYLRVKAPEVMTSVINLAIVQGNGVGKPMGIMNSPALVSVAAETSQPADTIHHRNLVKMRGRMYAPHWPKAVWLMHQDVWAQMPLLSFRDVGAYPSTASGTAVPAYMDPSSGISGAPFGTLFGRPIKVLQAMETIGDLGDIILTDMNAYRALTKAGGTRVDTSIHLKFDTDETVYRFIFRLAGAPWWSAPISPRDGTNTLSPFVTLASR
jgi:HK97 family phage major capsid protein